MSAQGSCLCGAVRYRVSGPLRPVIACHCGQCRKTSGHFVAATAAHRDRIEIEGEVRWYRSSQTARRGFCPVCGSPLFWDSRDESLGLFAGALDTLPPDLRLAGHIYCADRPGYYDIADGTPQADGDDPDLALFPR